MNNLSKNAILLLAIILIRPIKAQIISSDTALLVELVTTTTSQLNELEKLVSNAEKYTAKMQHYNELFQDEYFRAERILYLAESVTAKKEVQNLGDLNFAIKDLKYSMEDLKGLMREYSLIKEDENKTKQEVVINLKLNEQKEKIAQSQVEKAINAKTASRSNQLTAQNTAMIYESNVDMQNTQLKILEKVSTTNRLLAEELEEKRALQIEREKSYGIKRDK